MAISIDWPTGVITINQSDPEVSLVSGTTYELDTPAFRLALKALEDDVAGIMWPRTHRHNTTVTIDGINYVRSFEIINGYTITVLPDTPWRLRMDGLSNNNLHSEGILNLNSVQVIPANSAGNTTTEVGVSGLTAQESADLATAASGAPDLADLVKHHHNKQLTSPTTGRMTLYDDDGVTPLEEWDIWENEGETIPYRGRGVEVRDPI